MIKKFWLKVLFLTSILLPLAASADNLIWKFTLISALPTRTDVPTDFCIRATPDTFIGSLALLQQSGISSQNGMLIKFRSLQVNSENGLFFTKINAQISRKLDANRTWYTTWYIHLQQLSRYGVADGVWSTVDCKGRLIAQPLNQSDLNG